MCFTDAPSDWASRGARVLDGTRLSWGAKPPQEAPGGPKRPRETPGSPSRFQEAPGGPRLIHIPIHSQLDSCQDRHN
eukprot:2328642-Pyramimonas_sp.AAC.1